MIWPVSKWFPFSSLCWKHKGIFLHIHCENLVEMQEIKLTTIWEPLNDWIPLEFSPVRAPHMEFPAVNQLQFMFPCPTLVPADVAVLVSCDSTYLAVGLSGLGAAFCPVSSLPFHI